MTRACAILNMYLDPRMSEQVLIEVGDKIISHTDDYDLTPDKAYEVLFINSIDMITIENDKGEQDIYSVEWFKGKLSNTNEIVGKVESL